MARPGVLAVVLVALLLLPLHRGSSADIPFETFKKEVSQRGPGGLGGAQYLVEKGLGHDRQWVLHQLLTIVEKPRAYGDERLSALYYLREHGDFSTIGKLEAIAARMSIPSDAALVRGSVYRLCGRLIRNPEEKYRHWVKVLWEGTIFDRIHAIEALGDLGDRRAIGEFVRIAAHFKAMDPPPQPGVLPPSAWTKFRRELGDSFDNNVALALEKIQLLSRMPRVRAYSVAANGAPRKEFLDSRLGGACRLKVWGIKSLGAVGTPESLDVLENLFFEYDRQFKDCLKAGGGRQRDAHRLFAVNHTSDYFYLIHATLQKAGRDPSKRQPIAGKSALFWMPD